MCPLALWKSLLSVKIIGGAAQCQLWCNRTRWNNKNKQRDGPLTDERWRERRDGDGEEEEGGRQKEVANLEKWKLKELKMCEKARNRETHGKRWKEKQKEEMMVI